MSGSSDQATLLKKLFDTVIIPEAVSEELMAFHPQIPDFVRVQSVTARHRRLSRTEKLGKGEAEAILLAKEVGADMLFDRFDRRPQSSRCGPMRMAFRRDSVLQRSGPETFRQPVRSCWACHIGWH
jgi:predicted nucleic acid-binding protein